ncbi:MAG: hypothetical protein M9897_06850 [Brumimicrobium sp.]|nr:hypothetical protein [Brumimicrobium sp.]
MKKIRIPPYLRIILIIVIFFIIPIIAFLNIQEDPVYFLFVGYFIVLFASGDRYVLKLNDTSLLLLSVLSFLSFMLFNVLTKQGIQGVFLYSVSLAYSLLYYKFNLLSWKKYQQDIDFVGGPGFNISKHNTPLGILFSFLLILLGGGYLVLYLYLL